MKKGLLICLLVGVWGSVMAQDIKGKWFGKLDANGVIMRIVFRVEGDSTGLRCVMDAPDQKIYDVPVNRITWEAEKLTIESQVWGMVYEGKLNEQGDIVGAFKQENFVLPLTLSRKDGGTSRPQEPCEPYPYQVEEVRIENVDDDFTLIGTLTLPGDRKDFPVVVLISDNGPQNRDAEIEGHKPFVVLADHLTRQGIGVLRVDDRGTGMSTGNYAGSDLKDFVGDAEAAVTYLQKRGFNKIGLIGHGVGGAVASFVANEMKDIAFVVLLAGSGVRGDELIPLQIASISKASGLAPEVVKINETCNRKLLKHLAETVDTESAKAWISKQLARFYREYPILGAYGVTESEYVTRQVERIFVPEFLSMVRYDPAAVLRKIQCPILALFGGMDLQIPIDINAVAMRKIFAQLENKQTKVKVFPSMNHLFQECRTGLPLEYSMIDQTMSPTVLVEISDWIKTIEN